MAFIFVCSTPDLYSFSSWNVLTHRLDKFVQIQSRLAMAHYVRILQRPAEFGKLTENKLVS